jgi:ABC-type transport system involved in multi-copper enzyme maturation permease subunit
MNKVLAIAGVVVRELYRRKDFYVLFVLTALITLLLGAVNFFNDPRIVRYLKEVCLLLIWISALVIAVVTTARQLPAERENRTIFPLLAKPVTRWQVILGKFFGCWFAAGIALLVFYLFFAVISESRGGGIASAAAPAAAAAAQAHAAQNPEASEHASHDEEAAATRNPVRTYLEGAWLHWMMLAVVIAMVLFGSLIFAAPSSNATILFIVIGGILLLGEHLNKVALRQSEPVQTILQVIYFAIPHLEWFDLRDFIIYDHPPVAWWACALATAYAAAYTLLFLLAAWLVFRRKGLTS